MPDKKRNRSPKPLHGRGADTRLRRRPGRAAIIEHAGPLYKGDAGSGESEIRRWLLKNDFIEAIIALPVDLFYNTGLQTYIWILSKNKSKRRRGKVLFMEDLTKKKPVIKTGAEFPFTRYFYKYQECEPSEKVMGEIAALEKEIGEELKALKEVL